MSLQARKQKDYRPLSSSPEKGRRTTQNGPATLRSTHDRSCLTPEPEQVFARSKNGELYGSPVRVSEDMTAAELHVVPPPVGLEAEPVEELRLDRKTRKKAEQSRKDHELLGKERWLVRNGHFVTFIGLYLFSIMVLFRPYEIIGGMRFLQGTAFYFALGTLAIFLPSQIAAESNLTMLSKEVKAILAMTLIALVTVPIAKDPNLAWETFNEPFIKAVVIFLVLVNVVRTRKRLLALMWLSFGIGIYLAATALSMYSAGQFNVESYRVSVDIGGMFGNPNDMALHFVMMTPLTFALALGSQNKFMKIVYFGLTVLFVGGNMVTFSRGGFLGLLASAMCLAWKLGRKYRLQVGIASIVGGAAFIIAAPGNYGLRMLSIFVPGLDPVGSSDARRDLLERSILVTLRNPWGIGIGCFPVVGQHDHQTHNAFTQVSSETGLVGLAAYLVFIISPFRKLGAIERKLFDANEHKWFYYLAVGLQASIVGYLVSSTFASVAYNWFIYYGIAYAVAFRRVYNAETEAKRDRVVITPWEAAFAA